MAGCDQSKHGDGVTLSNCKCPSNRPYSSQTFTIASAPGYLFKVCGDTPFAPGIQTPNGTIGDDRDPFSRPMIMSPGEPPPLNVPSRANQKANIFTKSFDPKTRKIIVLLIAGFLLFLAAIHAE